jgi:hypothetical protein
VGLVVVVGLAQERLVRTDQVDDLAADDALAGRAALVQAVIAVGVEGALVPVDADLDPVLPDDADIAVLHLDFVTNEHLLRHPARAPSSIESRFLGSF